MDKQWLLDFLNTYYKQNNISLDLEDAVTILKEYALEKGHKEEEINKLFDTIVTTGMHHFLLGGLDNAIDYFKRKFYICEVRKCVSKDSQVLLYY